MFIMTTIDWLSLARNVATSESHETPTVSHTVAPEGRKRWRLH